MTPTGSHSSPEVTSAGYWVDAAEPTGTDTHSATQHTCPPVIECWHDGTSRLPSACCQLPRASFIHAARIERKRLLTTSRLAVVTTIDACTEHWERVGARAGSASQSNGADTDCGLSSTDLDGRCSRANAEMTTLEMAEEEIGLAQSLGSSLLGVDLALDFEGTQRAPSITAESPVSLVRRLPQKPQSTSVSD